MVMSSSGTELLDAIAEANQRLVDLAVDLRRRRGVRHVEHLFSCQPYRSPNQITLDIYVDAELQHGPSLVWNLAAWWHPTWGVEASVDFVRGEDQEAIRRYPVKRSDSAGEFLADLARTLDALVGSADEINVGDYLERWPEAQSAD
jgi:hypothetical protein